MILMDPSHIKRKGLTYSTYYLPSVGEMDELLKLDGTITFYKTTAYGYWTSSHNGVDAPYYKGWSGGVWVTGENLEAIEFEVGEEGGLNAYPIRHFNHTDNTTYPLETLMPSGGYIFYIADNGDGTYKHYESAPTVIKNSIWYDVTTYNPSLSSAIAQGLTNSETIVASVGHVYSSANDCLNYT